MQNVCLCRLCSLKYAAEHALAQVALAVAIHGPAADGSLVAGSPRNAPGGGALDKRATDKAASLEMQELVRAYTQFGHLTTASGHTLKKIPDLHLHNAGAWGLTLGCRKSVCADCCGNVPPGWRFTTVAIGNNPVKTCKTLRAVPEYQAQFAPPLNEVGGEFVALGRGITDQTMDPETRLYLCFRCARRQRRPKHACFNRNAAASLLLNLGVGGPAGGAAGGPILLCP
jgi:hypothetical protein